MNKYKEYNDAYNKENRIKILESGRTKKIRNREFINNYKREHPCVDCGQYFHKFPQCLDFDHKDRATKTSGISVMGNRAYSLERIKNEMDKCELRCANCHRVKTVLEARIK